MNSSQPALLRELQTDQKWLVTISRRLLARADDAEDLAQEASVRALEARAGRRVVPVDEARPWLIQTVRRLAWNANRREAVRASAPLEDQLDLAQATPVDALARAEFRKVVASLVMDLPEVEKQTLILRFYEDLSTAEIMEATGAPSKDAVRQRLSRGVRRLREQLDSRGDQADWRQAAFAISSAAAAKGGASGAAPMMLVALALGTVGAGGWFVLGSSEGDARPGALTMASDRGDDRPNRWEMGLGAPPMRIDVAAATSTEERLDVASPDEIVITIQDEATGRAVANQPWFVIRTGEHDYGRAWTFSGELSNPEPIAAGVTDSMGVLRFHGPGDALLHLCTERTDHHARGSWALRVDGDDWEPRAVALSQGTTFTGRVVDDLGEPRGGWVVAAKTYSDEWRPLGTTDEDGAFAAPHCADFPRSFVIREDGAVEPTRTLRTELAFVSPDEVARLGLDPQLGIRRRLAARGREAATVGDVVCPRGVTLRGRVWGSDGRPAQGATVSAGSQATATTDSDGGYVLLLPGRRGGTDSVELRANLPGMGEATLEVTELTPGAVLPGRDLQLDGLRALELRWVSATETEASDRAMPDEPQLATILWDVEREPSISASPAQWTAEVMPLKNGGKVQVPGAQVPLRGASHGAIRGTLVVPGWAPAVFYAAQGNHEIVVPMERSPEAHVRLTVEGDAAEHFAYAKVTITAQPPPPGLSPAKAARHLAAGPGTSTVAHDWENGERRALPLAAGSGFYVYATLFSGTARAPRVLPVRGPIALTSATADSPYEFSVSLARWPERQRLDQTAIDAGASVALSARRPTTITARVVDGVTNEFLPDALMRSVDTRHQHRSVQRERNGDERRMRLESSVDQVTLRFDCKGYEPFEVGPLHLEPGGEVDLGDVALWAMRRVPCQVVDPGGAPVAGVRRVSWWEPASGWTGLRTTELGQLELFVGDEPPKVVVVSDVQGSTAPPQHVRIQWNEDGECFLVLQPWRRVRLRIEGLDLQWRRGVGEILVEARGAHLKERNRRASFASPRMAGDDVIFDIDLPPGNWSIHPAAPEFVSFPTVEVEVPRNATHEAIEVTTRAQLGRDVAR